MSDIKALTPDERLKRIRNDERRANLGTLTSLAGLTAAGLIAGPQFARTKAAKKLTRHLPKRAEKVRRTVSHNAKNADSAATKVFLYGAAPGAVVGLGQATSARQDAKAAKRRIRSDGSLKPESQVRKNAALRLTRRAKVRQGGLVRQKTGGSTYRRGGITQ